MACSAHLAIIGRESSSSHSSHLSFYFAGATADPGVAGDGRQAGSPRAAPEQVSRGVQVVLRPADGAGVLGGDGLLRHQGPRRVPVGPPARSELPNMDGRIDKEGKRTPCRHFEILQCLRRPYVLLLSNRCTRASWPCPSTLGLRCGERPSTRCAPFWATVS